MSSNQVYANESIDSAYSGQTQKIGPLTLTGNATNPDGGPIIMEMYFKRIGNSVHWVMTQIAPAANIILDYKGANATLSCTPVSCLPVDLRPRVKEGFASAVSLSSSIILNQNTANPVGWAGVRICPVSFQSDGNIVWQPPIALENHIGFPAQIQGIYSLTEDLLFA